MHYRSLLGAMFLIGAVSLTGCGRPSGLDSIQVTPASQALTTGQTAGFAAIGTFGNANRPSTKTLTTGVSWSSSSPGVATIDSTGLATAVGAGTTTITATAQGFNGPVSSSGTLIVTNPSGSGGGVAGEDLLSIVVIPGSITVNNLYGTGQFLAYGTFATAPTVMDITNGINHNGYKAPVTWISSAPYIFPINSAGAPGATGGLITAVGSGTDVVYATAANTDGTVVYSPSVSFNCPLVAYDPGDPTATPPVQPTLGSCNDHTIASGLLVTLTVFNAGLNQSNWLLTAPSATGTPNVINCGPGAGSGPSVCTATYPLGTNVTITAPAQSGVNFGGWSWNCTPTVPVTAAGPNSCTINLGGINSSNESVGAIFN